MYITIYNYIYTFQEMCIQAHINTSSSSPAAILRALKVQVRLGGMQVRGETHNTVIRKDMKIIWLYYLL